MTEFRKQNTDTGFAAPDNAPLPEGSKRFADLAIGPPAKALMRRTAHLLPASLGA